MQQFIVSMERVAAQSVWGGRNRFDSFAPIRMNVAAQWLVDGVSRVASIRVFSELTRLANGSGITTGI